MMLPALPCPDCGSLIQPDRAGGLCPHCVLTDALGGSGTGAAPEPDHFAGHELLGEIARGGMGVVYHARQRRPDREVALKCLDGSALGRQELRDRFQAEAAALAALDHPGILPVYQFGEADGIPFFTMKLARGGSLAQHRTRYQGDWKGIARLVREVALAVQHVHERGLLHRDLKAGNILFDDAGRALVADFGIARLAAPDPVEALLQSGTPACLAPEVVRREDFTAFSDLWGLGIVLYELLAQRLPFTGETRAALLQAIISQAPPPMPAGVPRDLEAIAGKLLAKSLDGRYPSARAVADDLGRWLEGRPVLARPATGMAQAIALIQRNPLLSASLALLVLTLAAFSFLQWRSNRELRQAYRNVLLQESRNLRLLHRHQEALGRIAEAGTLTFPDNPVEWRTEAAAALAVPRWQAARAWPVPRVSITGLEAFTPDLAAWIAATGSGTWELHRTSDGALLQHRQTATASDPVRFLTSAAGNRVVSLHADGTSALYGPDLLWQHQAGRYANRMEPALHPDGVQFITAHPEHGAWIGRPGQPRERQIVPAPVEPHPMRLDPTGHTVFLITGPDKIPGLWSVADGRLLCRLRNPPGTIGQVAWSPDGRLLALTSLTLPAVVRLYDPGTGGVLEDWMDHDLPVVSLAWHPDSQSFATVADDGRLVWRLPGPGGWKLQRPASERALAFRPDGTQLGYSPGDGQLGLLDLTESLVFQLWPAPALPSGEKAYQFSLADDGSALLVMERTGLRLWNAATRTETSRTPFEGKTDWGHVFFEPEGHRFHASRLGYGVWSGEIRENTLTSLPALPGHEGTMIIEPAPDRHSLVVMNGQGAASTAWLWPQADPARAQRLVTGFPMLGFRLIPGTSLGFSSHWSEPDLWIWETTTGTRRQNLGLTGPVGAEPSPDGRWLVASTASENVLFDTRAWTRASTWPAWPGGTEAFSAAFSPEGDVLAQSRPDGSITLRQLPAGTELLTLIPPSPVRLQQIRFAPGGRLLGLSSSGRLMEWNLPALQEALTALELGW